MLTFPNILTGLNLFSGCIGLLMVFEGRSTFAIYCLGFCLLFDFLDGFVARLLGQNSNLGVQLDSLADVISFGLLPGMMMFKLIENTPNEAAMFFSFFGFILPVAGAFRLARFNIETTGESKDFSGLPIPAMAIFISGIYAMVNIEKLRPELLDNLPLLICLILGMSILMLSRLPVIKVSLGRSFIRNHYVLCIVYLICFSFFIGGKYISMSIIIIVHLLYSIIFQKTLKN